MSEHAVPNLKATNLLPGSVLFGAGGSAKNYVQNSLMQPLVVVDNDPKKWGTLFAETIIQSPESIDWSKVSQVVVASDGAVEIRRQLLGFGVPSHAIMIPPKRLLGPLAFQDNSARVFALEFVAELMRTEESRFPVIAVFGLALGLVRDSDIIAWDDDIDLYAFVPDTKQVIKALAESSAPRFLKPRKIVCEITVPMGKKFDLSVEFFDPKAAQLFCFAYGKHWAFEMERFLQPTSIVIRGRNYNVPSSPVKYLTAIYGSDWEQPRPDFTALDYSD